MAVWTEARFVNGSATPASLTSTLTKSLSVLLPSASHLEGVSLPYLVWMQLGSCALLPLLTWHDRTVVACCCLHKCMPWPCIWRTCPSYIWWAAVPAGSPFAELGPPALVVCHISPSFLSDWVDTSATH